MQDVSFVKAITGHETTLQMGIPSCSKTVSIGQSKKVRPLFGWSGSSCLWRAASTSNLRMTWYLSWRTRCRIATAIRRSDIWKLCCNAVKLQPWRQGILHGLYHWEKLGRPRRIQYVTRHGAACLYYVYWCFMFFPSLPVTASASCPRCFLFFSQLRATAFEISGPWTGTARSHGRKTGGKGHCCLSFWKLVSFWICWPGHPEVAAGVARRYLQTIATGVARRLKKCDTSRAHKDIDGLIGDTLICWLTLEWMADWLIDSSWVG